MHSIAYVYEPNRNLMTIVDNQVGASSVSKFTYRYQGPRVEKKVASFNGTEWTIDSHQRFVYEGWNLIATFDASSSPLGPQSTYLWGLDLSGSMQGAHSTGSGLKARSTGSGLKAGGVGGLLSATKHQEPGTPTFYPTYDANGNVSEYLDESGAIEAHYEYSPFGRVIASTGTADAFAFRFSTKYTDNETGLLYYGFRYYDPQTGRWLSRDPIEERGGLNLYGFVGNTPIGWWDFLGMRSVQCCGGKKLKKRESCCRGTFGEEPYSRQNHLCCEGRKYNRFKGSMTVGRCCKNGELKTAKRFWKQNNFESEVACVRSCMFSDTAWSIAKGAGAGAGAAAVAGKSVARGAASGAGSTLGGMAKGGAAGAAGYGLVLATQCVSQCGEVLCDV